MAYRILYDDKLLYDPYTDDIVWDVVLSSNVNSGISLSFLDFTIPTTHSLAQVIKEKDGVVKVYSDDFKLFEGYIENISSDMYDSRTVSCCSAMNYLYDTIVRPYSTEPNEEPLKAPTEIDKLFKWYIDQHNSHVMNSKQQFTIGVNQGLFLKQSGHIYARNSSLPSTADEIASTILGVGGYLFLRFEEELKILDLYADAHEANTQLIDFGVNLVDFTKTTETANQYTAIRPVGGTPQKVNQTDPDPKPVTIESIVNGRTSFDSDMMKRNDVVYSMSGVQRYGYREFAWSENETTDPDMLLRLAVTKLRTVVNPELAIDIKGIDLSLYLPKYQSLVCGQVARVRSKPHKIDEYLMLNAIDLDLQVPENSTYTFGVSFDTFTGQQSKFIKSLNSSINSQLDKVDAIGQEAKDAADKAQDAADKAEKAIISVTDQFYQSESPTELIGGEWVETNTWEQGKYTWRRSLNVYGDYTQEYIPSATGICISGNTGPEGPPGFDGRGIQSYSVEYQISNSGTNPPTGAWSKTPLVATDAKPYLWVKNTVHYTDGTESTFYSISPKGSQGQQGDPGDQGIQGPPGENGDPSYLHIAYANSADGSIDFSTTDSTNKLYIGQYPDFTPEDSTDPSKYSWTRIKGDTGEDGRGIRSYSVGYQLSSSGTVIPDGVWATTPLVATDAKPYLWVKNTIIYTDNTNETFYSVVPRGSKGQQGDPGDQGIPGTPGSDGKTTYLHIAYANSSDGKTGFSTTDSTNKLYIGQYTDFVAVDSTDPTKYSWTKIKGEQGDSVTITKTSISYQVSYSGTVTPTTWLPTIPETPKGSYLWTRTIVTYSDGNQTVSYSVAYNGTNGSDGKDGNMLYATSDTAGATKDKVATLTSGIMDLVVGTTVSVTFTYANSANSPTLNVQNTGAKPIMTSGVAYAYWAAGTTVVFVYSGSHWMTASTPVYAPTSTIGNPVGGNVHTDSETVNIRDGEKNLASFARDGVELGKNNPDAKILLCGGNATIDYLDYVVNPDGSQTKYEIATLKSSRLNLVATNGDEILESTRTRGTKFDSVKIDLVPSQNKSFVLFTLSTNHDVDGDMYNPSVFTIKDSSPITYFHADNFEEYQIPLVRKLSIDQYPVLRDPNGGSNYYRTTESGLLPYLNGNSYVGTNVWRFKEIHGVKICPGDSVITGDSNWIYTNGVAAEHICTNKSSLYPVWGGRVIYNAGSNGTTNSFTVSEAFSNFKKIHFVFRTNDWVWDSVDVYGANGGIVNCATGAITGGSGNGWYKSKQFKISGTTAAYTGYAGESGIGAVSGGTNYMNSIYVCYVIGYK